MNWKEDRMMHVRKAGARGHADHGWLDTRHTFSFADYFDPAHMGFRTLRVINEDRVQPGQGFGTHGHRDMEIVTCVLSGALEHRDSLGNGSVLRAGELQRMTAGTGVRHSEFNPSATEPVHFYQIWLLPERKGLEPGYEQRRFDPQEQRGRWRLVASGQGRDGSLTIRQDADLFLSSLAAGQRVAHAFGAGRHGWLQVLRGRVEANGVALAAGDGVAVSDEARLEVAGLEEAEVMLFDLN
jgi:redox-sensitive bicupin YhaK (pirin superfamily)